MNVGVEHGVQALSPPTTVLFAVSVEAAEVCLSAAGLVEVLIMSWGQW